jgi:polygalacturonase
MHTSLYNVLDYGAIGSGSVLDTDAINQAISAAAKAGGGTVYFPAGRYLCFSIHLRSNVQLWLAQGAVIQAATSPLPGQTTGQLGGAYDKAENTNANGKNDVSSYPYERYQDFGHSHFANSLMYAIGDSNLGVGGPGLIHGNGLASGNYNAHPSTDPNVQAGYEFNPEQVGVGNKSIAMLNCTNITLRDFSILQGGHFGILLTGCVNVTADNIKIDTNRDGMDIDCGNNIRVSNCAVNSPWDDGICMKSTYATYANAPGGNIGAPEVLQNITITNCTVSGSYTLGSMLDGSYQRIPPSSYPVVSRFGRIKFGTESYGGLQRLTVSNCVFDGCYGIALESVDGAVCEDIAITNIAMRDIVASPLFFILGNRLGDQSISPPGVQVGAMRRILVSNVVVSNSNEWYTNIITGVADSEGNIYRVEDVQIANFYMQQRGGAPSSWADFVPFEFGDPHLKNPDPGFLPPRPKMNPNYPEPVMFGIVPAQGFFLRHIREIEMSQVAIHAVTADQRPSFVLDDVITSWFHGIKTPLGWPQLNVFTSFQFLSEIDDFHTRSCPAAPDCDNGNPIL